MLDPDDRYHIEDLLGRALTSEDLTQASTFGDLTRTQLAIVERVVPRGILAIKYVHAVVPSADFSDVRELVYNIQTYVNKRFPPERLPMEHLYGGVLGRPLTNEERNTAESLQALSQVQLDLARQLSLKEKVYGVLYLGDVVRSSGPQDREAFADALRRSDKP